MKTIRRICTVMLLVLMAFPALHAQSYDNLWKQLEEAREKSLPQTVIRLADQIWQKAQTEKNAPQMLKAYVCRQACQKRITPDSLYTSLAAMERWAQEEADETNRAILHSLLARQYADLLSTNRRTLLNSPSLLVDEAPADVREWSLNLFIDRIDAHLQASLQPVEALLHTTAADYDPFVIQQDGSRFYAHNLYHLLARRAVDTYQGWRGLNVDSLMDRRIKDVYQTMIATYRQRPDAEDAVVMATLDYEQWRADMQSPDGYLQTLDSLIAAYGTRDVCGEVYIRKAQWLNDKRRYAQALRVCDEGLKRYAAYKRIGELKNIRARILQPALNIYTAEGYPSDSVSMRVNYRNLSGFTLNVYATDYDERPWLDDGLTSAVCRRHGRLLASHRFALRPLPGKDKAAEDVPYHSCDTTLHFRLPDDVGVYILQAVPEGEKTLHQSYNFLCVSRFKVLSLNVDEQTTEFITLDALTGHPIAGVQLSFYSDDSKNRRLLTQLTTDSEGKALLTGQPNARYYVARKGDDRAMTLQYFRQGISRIVDSDTAQKMLTLLIDRAIYRPGQTVYVKGIAYEQTIDAARVLEGADYELLLLDANRKELASRKVRTNDFGSFSAEFVLPSACLNGAFSITTRKHEDSASFRVEEYKRPTFEISFTPVAEAYRLGDRVMLRGNVKSFNGMSVQDVPLAFTVTRHDLLRSYFVPSTKPLLADTVRLDAEGNFCIPLTLEAPADTSMGGYRYYHYQVEASVTDDAGETQTASYSILATTKAYSFMADVPQVICKEDSLLFTISVANGVQQPQAVKGCYLLRPADADRIVLEGDFVANQRQDFSSLRSIPSGKYRMTFVVTDSLGREENSDIQTHSIVNFTLFSEHDTRLSQFTELFVHQPLDEFDETQPADFFFGTSFKDAYVLMDVFTGRRRIETCVLQLCDSLMHFTLPYRPEYGEGVTLTFNFVKQGLHYSRQLFFKKRQPNRTLDLKWEVFRDRLRPGQEEEWKLVIKTPQGLPASAEMLATMYDASLDKLFRHNQSLNVYFSSRLYSSYRNASRYADAYFNLRFPLDTKRVPAWAYDYFYTYFSAVGEVLSISENSLVLRQKTADAPMARGVEESADAVEVKYVPAAVFEEDREESFITGALPEAQSELRTNFAETAFFYPYLRTNEQGEVSIAFTMPQSLTRWRFRGYAHTKDMLTGQLEASAVTSKEFMLTPNLPRFVWVGDHTQIAATIANQTDKAVKGTVRFVLFDPLTEKVIDSQKQKFTADARRTTSVSFAFDVDERYNLLGVRIVADGDSFSDGEQHLVPVLSNKQYITETLAMPIRGGESRTFDLSHLFNGDSSTATDRRLTVEFTSNPAWYAVQALPVLAQPTTDNAIDWASAFYANSLASFIAGSQPRIKAVFDAWMADGGNKETFLSQLEKNQEVKNILLSESPWVLEAATESEQRRRIATLFDLNQLNNRNLSALTKLKELQGTDGSWSWYKGMSGSSYITSYVTELLVRLPQLTGQPLAADAQTMKQAAFGYLNNRALEAYRSMLKAEKKGSKVSSLSDDLVHYLYLVALSGEKLPDANRKAQAYFLTKIGGNLTTASVSCKARAAIILLSAGKKTEADRFIASLKEHLVQEDEMGAHFAFLDAPYSWSMMPVPAHVKAMEALRKAGGNDALVEEMKLWLLKQKQTTCWKSSVETADAIYALLCQGNDLLATAGDVRITLGREVIETTSPAADATPALGYVKETFTEDHQALKARQVTVEKRDAGIAWGAVYAQYLSPIADVKQQGGELNVEKRLYVERLSADGRRSLQPLGQGEALKVGDKVVSRLTIRLDRAMDFVQLKDQRGACFEPLSAFSGYRWSNGFGYYVEVEDAATNFFFDHLGKGVYVLEYSYRVARGGTYEAGLATLQCAYAPEYASHSAGRKLIIKN